MNDSLVPKILDYQRYAATGDSQNARNNAELLYALRAGDITCLYTASAATKTELLNYHTGIMPTRVCLSSQPSWLKPLPKKN